MIILLFFIKLPMKSYISILSVIFILMIETTFASNWLVSPSGKLTSEDRKTLEYLQKYQEPLIKKVGTTPVKTTSTNTPTTTGNATLQKQLDSIFANLQQRIADRSISSQNAIYNTLIARIKNIQAQNTNLSANNTFILNYLLEKSTAALKTVPSTSGSGTNTSTGNTSSSISGQQTFGGLTLTPMSFTNQTGTEVTLGEFELSQDVTLNDFYITISSDEAIEIVDTVDILKIRNGNGIVVGDADSYKMVDSKTLQVFFDAAYFLRA